MKGYYERFDDAFNTDAVEEVSTNLDRLMEINDVTIDDIHRETEITRYRLKNLLSGATEDVDLWEVYQLAEYFNVTIDEIIGRE
jgi:hypothetical protein